MSKLITFLFPLELFMLINVSLKFIAKCANNFTEITKQSFSSVQRAAAAFMWTCLCGCMCVNLTAGPNVARIFPKWFTALNHSGVVGHIGICHVVQMHVNVGICVRMCACVLVLCLCWGTL